MDPLALLPYALAAAGGRVGTYDVTALVAAGVTLLQRSAPLVRTLAGRRSAVLLPPGAAWLVALAASDGRGMVVLDPRDLTTSEAVGGRLRTYQVGAVFTNQALRPLVPAGVSYVLLDEAPRRARVSAGGREADIDLGTHFALDLVGDTNGDGSPEECLCLARTGELLSHAEILAAARQAMGDLELTPLHRTPWDAVPESLDQLVQSLVAPLLVAGAVDTSGTAR